MKFRCPYCRRHVPLDPGGAAYVAGQVFAHAECCTKRPDEKSPEELYSNAKQIARRVGARARQR
jgi:hypothetical protein